MPSRALCRSSFLFCVSPIACRFCRLPVGDAFSFGTVSTCSPLVLPFRALALRSVFVLPCVPTCVSVWRLALSSCVSPCRFVLRAVHRLAHSSRFLFALRAMFFFIRHRFALLAARFVVSCRSVPDDLDEPDEKLDETQDETMEPRRGTRRGSEKRDETMGREARAGKVESSYAVFPGAFNHIGAVSPCSSLIPFLFPLSPFRLAFRCLVSPCVPSVPPCRACRLVSSRALPCSPSPPVLFSSGIPNTGQSRRIKQGGGRRRRPEARMRAIGRSTKRQ